MRTSFVVAVALVAMLAACSSGGGDASTSTTRARADAERVTIDVAGFAPQWAVVAVGEHVEFVNRTKTSQRIVFDNARDASGAPLQSPPIAAGDTWRWTADSFASFAYHSPALPGAGGRIQVQPPVEND